MSISFCSVGDIMLGENVHHFKRGIVSKYGSDYTKLVSESILQGFSTSDFFFFNMESGIAPDKYFQNRNIDNGVYVAPNHALDLFKKIKSEKISNIANNHFSQHGSDIADYTFEQLTANGIHVVGKNNQPLTLEKNGKILKIWGVSLIGDKNYCNKYFLSSYDKLIQELDLRPKAENEIRIISIHWGEEYLTKQNTAQERLAKELSHNGFDFILGHHPHVVQPTSQIDKTWVIYSHGNFIFDQNFSGLTQKGLIFNYNLSDNKPKLLFSHQEKLRVVKTSETNPDNFGEFCTKNYHLRKPLIMRVRMKLELLVHFYELHPDVISKFFKRMIRRKS